MYGKHCLKSWSVTQIVVSLSPGEAEYYAMVKGGSVGMGFQSLLQEIGVSVKLQLKCDASAAVGIVKRRGLGKIRHIDVTQLWLQEKVAQEVIDIVKVNTKEKVSGGLTKGVSRNEIIWLLSQVGQEIRDNESCHGHAVSACPVHSLT